MTKKDSLQMHDVIREMDNRCARRIQLAPTNFAPCGRRASVFVGGEWFCKRHDPEARRARQEASDKKILARTRRQAEPAPRAMFDISREIISHVPASEAELVMNLLLELLRSAYAFSARGDEQ